MTIVLLSPNPASAEGDRCRPGDVEKTVTSPGPKRWRRRSRCPLCLLNKLVLAKYAGLTVAEVKEKYFSMADRHAHQPGRRELNAACVAEGLRDFEGRDSEGLSTAGEIGMSSNALWRDRETRYTRIADGRGSGP